MKKNLALILGILSLLGAGFAPKAWAGGYYVTDMDLFHQEQDNWCWAAVSETVLNKMGSGNIAQCKLATYFVTSGPDAEYCCNSANGESSICNQGYLTQNVLYTYGALKQAYTGQLDQQSLINEVYNGYPVVFHIYFGTHAHASLIYGATYENEIYVWDPGNGGDKYVLPRAQVENYAGGLWYESLTTKNTQ